MERNEKGKNIVIIFKAKPSAREMSIFCRQLSILLESGMTITAALKVIARGQKKAFQKTILLMTEQIEKGEGIGQAAEKTGRFPPLFVEMMGMAEKTGGLSDILNALSDHFQRQDELRSEILQVTFYPMIVLILSVIIIIFLLTEVVPIFVDIITSLSGEIPMMTKMMISLGQGLSKIWRLLIPLLLLFLVAKKSISKDSLAAEKWGRFVLKCPLLGRLISDHACMQLAGGLKLLIQGGVDLPESLLICKGLVGNTGMGIALERISGEVKKGRSLTECMDEAGVFPAEFCQMIAIGEETGAFIQTLEKASAYYLENFSRKTKMLTTLMEPLVMIFVGLMVLIVMLAMMQPIYEIYQSYTQLM